MLIVVEGQSHCLSFGMPFLGLKALTDGGSATVPSRARLLVLVKAQ